MKIKIIRNFFLFVITFLTLGAPSFAANLSAGGEIFQVVPPKGLVDFTGRDSFANELVQRTTRKSMLLMATYLTEEDVARSLNGQVPLVNKYAKLTIYREFLTQKMSAKEFILNRNKLRDAADQSVKNLRGKVDYSNVENFLRDRTGVEATVRLNDIVPLGVDSESNRHITFGMLLKNTISSKEKTTSPVIMMEVSAVYIRQQILNLTTYALFETPEDIAWVRKVSAEFVNNLIRDNP
jgi:hypothetical protein